jgi:hypothetical protein
VSIFKNQSENSCAYCGSKIIRKAPVSPLEGMAIAQKYANGQIKESELTNFYKSIGNNCPSCSKISCSYCFHENGDKCPNCGSKIKYFS